MYAIIHWPSKDRQVVPGKSRQDMWAPESGYAHRAPRISRGFRIIRALLSALSRQPIHTTLVFDMLYFSIISYFDSSLLKFDGICTWGLRFFLSSVGY